MEKTNNIKRSNLWNEIYNIVKRIPRKDVEYDAVDAPSAASSIEELITNDRNIKSRLFVHKPNWSIPYGLKIEGYEGHGKSGYGGQYTFVATYISSSELEGRNEITLDNWCKEKNIPFIHSNNFEDLTEQLKTFDRPELKDLHQFE